MGDLAVPSQVTQCSTPHVQPCPHWRLTFFCPVPVTSQIRPGIIMYLSLRMTDLVVGLLDG